MARTTLDDTYRGGRVLPEDDKPKRLRYPCFATGCPMPGSIFMSGTDKPGSCAWHYGVATTDIPKVTQVLKDWIGVSFEVDECRRVMSDPATASDPTAQDTLFAKAVERLRPFVHAGGWGEQFEANRGTYGSWGRRLEAFLGARVVEVLSINQRRIA